MPCDHRFINDLYPNGQLKYLFVGTFNPIWDRPQNDNAYWFYSRQYNDFWFIMPQIFGHESLMDKNLRTNRQFLNEYCIQNNIGITDLISSINDADINNPSHKEIILSVKDKAFDAFSEIIPTDIVSIIEANSKSLCGVYLTRYEDKTSNGIINNLWAVVKNRCIDLDIHYHDLVTPSRQFRKLTRVQKQAEWMQKINICT